jgi:DNA-binding NtrC family response regulator
VDVRVVATSNRDLEKTVAEGKFREDLFYRLNVVPVELPSLRHRLEDVPELARHFLQNIAKRDRSPVRVLEPEAVRTLQRYDWPGNVRELQNIVERACVLEAQPGLIRSSTLEPWLRAKTSIPSAPAATPAAAPVAPSASPVLPAPFPSAVSEGTHLRPLSDIERDVILTTLRQFKGHRIKTAQALGIGVRTLGMKLKKWKEEGVPEAAEA